MLRIFVALVFVLVAMPVTHAETPEQWVALLTRVHGGFGSFLPVGIHWRGRHEAAQRKATRA